jgi:hypothetical protein
MNYNNSDIGPTNNYARYKNVVASNLDLFSATAKNEYLGMEYVHEHLFKVYDPFLLDHGCRKGLLIKCATCSDTFCNGCGKRIKVTDK